MKTTLPIEGWMGKRARKWLARTAKRHTRIVEVGVWKGLSTRILAEHTRGTVFAVDHWQGVPADPAQHELYKEADESDVYAEFLANTAHLRNVTPVRMDSVSAAAHLLKKYGRSFDWVFIDADHSYEGASRDIAAYLPLLKRGGLMSGHDYKPTWPGVMQAVDEAFGDRVTIGPKSIWSITL